MKMYGLWIWLMFILGAQKSHFCSVNVAPHGNLKQSLSGNIFMRLEGRLKRKIIQLAVSHGDYACLRRHHRSQSYCFAIWDLVFPIYNYFAHSRACLGTTWWFHSNFSTTLAFTLYSPSIISRAPNISNHLSPASMPRTRAIQSPRASCLHTGLYNTFQQFLLH